MAIARLVVIKREEPAVAEAKTKVLHCSKRGCKEQLTVDASCEGTLEHPNEHYDEHHVHLGHA